MARELGLNPKKFGKLDNRDQEPWKAPLPDFIEHIYFKHFGKARPDQAKSIEQIVKDQAKKKAERKAQKQLQKDAENSHNPLKPSEAKAIEIRVCFQTRLKNTDILVGTTNIEEARRIARIWGEKEEGEPVTRTIFRRAVVPHDGVTLTVEGVTVWPPFF